MKTFALIVALCVSGALADITSEQVTRLLRYKDECMGEIGIDDEIIEKAMKEGTSYHREVKLECFMACILKKVGIMNEDGSINVDAAKEHASASVPKSAVHESIKKCKDAVGANDCEKAANFVDCLMEKQIGSKDKN